MTFSLGAFTYAWVFDEIYMIFNDITGHMTILDMYEILVGINRHIHDP